MRNQKNTKIFVNNNLKKTSKWENNYKKDFRKFQKIRNNKNLNKKKLKHRNQRMQDEYFFWLNKTE